MSYEPTNWKDGDLVTSAKLNKMEQGIAAGGSGGITFVGMTQESPSTPPVLDKTWQEIYDAAQDRIVYIKNIIQNNSMSVIGFVPIINVAHSGEAYSIMGLVFDPNPDTLFFTTTSPDDYPVAQAPADSESDTDNEHSDK